MKPQYTEFLFYFDTKNHCITKNEFVQSLNTTQAIFENLNTNLFGNTFKVDIVVLPPEEGSLKQLIGIFVLTSALAAPIGEISSGFFSGLLGKDLKEYGMDAATFAKDYLKRILATTKLELEGLVPPEINIDKSIKHKSDLYKILMEDENIRGIKYGENDDGIKRERFMHYISSDIVRDLESEFEYRELQIYRPILGSVQRGKWEFVDNMTKEKVVTTVCDFNFINSILKGKLPLKQSPNPDIIKCQIQVDKKMINGEIIEKGKKLIVVYEYNDKKIVNIPNDFVVNIRLPKKPKKYHYNSLLDMLQGDQK